MVIKYNELSENKKILKMAWRIKMTIIYAKLKKNICGATQS